MFPKLLVRVSPGTLSRRGGNTRTALLFLYFWRNTIVSGNLQLHVAGGNRSVAYHIYYAWKRYTLVQLDLQGWQMSTLKEVIKIVENGHEKV